MDQKVCLNLAKKDQLCAIALKKRKYLKGLTQSGFYGNQPQPFEVFFYSTDANSSCSFTKQDFVFKQAYLVSLFFVLCNKLNF